MPYIVNEKTISLYMDRVMYSLENTKENLAKFFLLYQEPYTPENKKKLLDMFSILNVIREKLGDYFEIKENKVYLAGSRVCIPTILADRIKEATLMGYPISMLRNFWAKCLENPSDTSRQCLYDFLAKYSIPIHDNGDLIIYKAVYKKIIDKGAGNVTEHYTDIHTQTFKIHLGEEVRIPRNGVDADRNSSCSHGLHVGAFSYVVDFGSQSRILLACYVNPKDVVSVPNHECSKMRVCAYTPFEVVDEEFTKTYLGQLEMEMTGLDPNCDDELNDNDEYGSDFDLDREEDSQAIIDELQEEIDELRAEKDELDNKSLSIDSEIDNLQAQIDNL